MGEEAVLLRNVGLGSIADVLDGFYRQVLELTDEMREKVRKTYTHAHALGDGTGPFLSRMLWFSPRTIM